MERHCLTLDLIDDEKLIAAYKQYHKSVWPEIKESIKQAGVDELEIYLSRKPPVYDYGCKRFVFFRSKSKS